jgi:hypothetical protein
MIALIKKWFKKESFQIVKDKWYRKLFIWDFTDFAIREHFRKKFPKYNKPALSSKDWVDFDTLCEKTYPRLWKLHKVCSKMDSWVERRILDRLSFPSIFYRNYFVSKTHIIPTGLKRGQWHDSSKRLFHGMFSLLVYFVEQEDKSGFGYYEKRKSEEGYDPEAEPHDKARKELLEAYMWYTEEYPRHQADIDALYEEMPEREDQHIMAMFHNKDPLRDEIHEDISSIEWLIDGQKTYYMHIIVKHEAHLWS